MRKPAPSWLCCFRALRRFCALVDQRGVAVEQEIGVGLALEPAHATADLVELRQPEAVRALQ